MDPSAQLNAFILSLRRPAPTAEDRKLKLKYLAYLLPLIKNPQNLHLVVQELSLSSDLFADSSTVLLAVDAINVAKDRKFEVSDPTIAPEAWVAELVKASYSVPPLVGLVVVSGLRSTPDVLHIAKVILGSDADPYLWKLATACLARAQWDFPPDTFSRLPCDQIVRVVLHNVYNPDTLDLRSSASTTDFGSWSRLLSGALRYSSPVGLQYYLETTEIFVRTLVSRGHPVELLKPVLFGVVLQLEGLAAQAIASPLPVRQARPYFAVHVLRILQPLGFVIESVGSQFESYQFVWSSCLDVLSMSADSAVEAVRALGHSWGFGQAVGNSPVAAGGLVFFFELSEQLLPVIPKPAFEDLILPIAMRYLKFQEFSSVFEAAHSIMLAYFASHQDFRYSKRQLAMDYFVEIQKLFPDYLTAEQYRTAVEAVLSAVSHDDARAVLDAVYLAARNLPDGRLFPPSAERSLPDTSPPSAKVAYVSALAHGVAQKATAPEFKTWLAAIGPLVPAAGVESSAIERQWILKDLGDVVTSLGPELSDVGIQWWFGSNYARM